jgi:sulfur carrier protein
LRVNGEDRDFETELTIEQLLRTLDTPAAAVAVEVNRTVIPRRQHATHVLHQGDELEIVTFVGGG